MRRHDHVLAQAAGVGVGAAEVQAMAQVGMALLAQFAAPARLCRVDRHALADLQRRGIAVQAVRPDGFDDAGEFVTEDQRCLDHGVADARILVGVDVAAAHAYCRHAQQDFAGARCGWPRHLFDTQIARPV